MRYKISPSDSEDRSQLTAACFIKWSELKSAPTIQTDYSNTLGY